MILPAIIMMVADSLMIDTAKVDSTISDSTFTEYRKQHIQARIVIDSFINKLQNDTELKEKLKKIKAMRKK